MISCRTWIRSIEYAHFARNTAGFIVGLRKHQLHALTSLSWLAPLSFLLVSLLKIMSLNSAGSELPGSANRDGLW